ncbi:MAG: hypothetical protein IT162_00635 [Bryobacterales bacterium]|nr:hypothetical protein [Bryobacterales bacterium]
MADRSRNKQMSPPERYDEWLQYLFCRNAEQARFQAKPHEVVALATQMFLRAGTDLRGFSDDQICEGLQFLLYNTGSDLVFDLMSDAVPLPARLALIAAIPVLYRDCLAPRVAPALGHCNEMGGGLNTLCYMLWDVTPLGYWANRAHREEFNAALLKALSVVLLLRNDACVESALHGLGHLAADAGLHRVRAIVVEFLARRAHGDLRPELRRYAEHAAYGCVQ